MLRRGTNHACLTFYDLGKIMSPGGQKIGESAVSKISHPYQRPAGIKDRHCVFCGMIIRNQVLQRLGILSLLNLCIQYFLNCF